MPEETGGLYRFVPSRKSREAGHRWLQDSEAQHNKIAFDHRELRRALEVLTFFYEEEKNCSPLKAGDGLGLSIVHLMYEFVLPGAKTSHEVLWAELERAAVVCIVVAGDDALEHGFAVEECRGDEVVKVPCFEGILRWGRVLRHLAAPIDARTGAMHRMWLDGQIMPRPSGRGMGAMAKDVRRLLAGWATRETADGVPRRSLLQQREDVISALADLADVPQGITYRDERGRFVFDVRGIRDLLRKSKYLSSPVARGPRAFAAPADPRNPAEEAPTDWAAAKLPPLHEPDAHADPRSGAEAHEQGYELLHELTRLELMRAVRDAVVSLRGLQRLVVERALHYWGQGVTGKHGGPPLAEIARDLNKPLTTVQSAWQRAVKKIGLLLEELAA